jgi:hypothetical protein
LKENFEIPRKTCSNKNIFITVFTQTGKKPAEKKIEEICQSKLKKQKNCFKRKREREKCQLR